MPFTQRTDESGVLAFVRKHAVGAVLISVLLDVVVTAAVGFLYVQVNRLQSCQSAYLSGSATLATVRDAALQTIIDDITKDTSQETFLRDVKAEQAAYKALAHYRTHHIPAKGCQ